MSEPTPVPASILYPVTPALLEVKVSEYISSEYVTVIYDIARMAVLQTFLHLMTYFASPGTTLSETFGIQFWILLVYVSLGVCFFWLVLCRLVRIA